MSTYTQILYQIVYSTKNREHTLDKENRKELFKYIWGILKNKKCYDLLFDVFHSVVLLANIVLCRGGSQLYFCQNFIIRIKAERIKC